MGRRSINTTKSGKYMNPTDQARKEARKAELKKNKKQRQMVRAAVLKGKDPHQILEEMEKIDLMEFNVNQPSPLNEKVLKDKRKKLRETLDRVLIMYHKDDQEKYFELKKRQTEYEQKRNQIVAFYESVKTAQSVTVEEIPLPQIPQMEAQANVHANIPLPTTERKAEHTIYSIATALKLQSIGQPVRDPPGCPPGPAPNINEDGEVEEFGANVPTETEEEEEEVPVEKEVRKPMNALQQKMIALSGQNIDEFMKDLETAQQKKAALLREPEPDRSHLTAHIEVEPLLPPGTNDLRQARPVLPTMVPPPLMFTGAGIRLPPGPPPRPLLPPGPPPGLPRGLPPLRIPLPPTPSIVRLPGPPLMAAPRPVPSVQPNVLSAAPQLINRNESTKQGATISAKPQIRNLSADVTKFVPSALRVKREESKKKPVTSLARELKQKEMVTLSKSQQGGQHKDDAYKQFMQEMERLM